MAFSEEKQRRHRGDRGAFSANLPNRDRIKATVALLDWAGLAERIAGWLLSSWCGAVRAAPLFRASAKVISAFPLPSASSLFVL